MKYIGIISRYDESKKFGFIKSNQTFTGMKQDMFFHVSDCSFSPNINEIVLFDVGVYKGRVKAFDVEYLTKEIDNILDKWSTYSDSDKKYILSRLDKYYRVDNLRSKMVELASHAMQFEDDELQNFFLRINEIFLLEEYNFENDCKNIIDFVVSDVISKEYPDINIILSQGAPPSLEECRLAIMHFIQNERPNIIYTHTIEDGYWTTHWKWDGSEDYYHEGSSKSEFESSHELVINGMTVNHNYFRFASGNFNLDMQAKNDELLEIYCFLKNSLVLWGTIISACRYKRDNLLYSTSHNIYKSAQQPIFKALSHYFSEKFPIYGHHFYNSIKYSYGKYKIEESDVNSQLIFDIDTKNINNQLINICRYIFSCIESKVEQKCAPLPNLRSIYPDSIENDGLLLSADGTTLCAVTDTTLQEIIVPASVTHIEDGAFEGCRELRRIQFLGTITYIGHGVFANNQLDICGDFSKLSFLGFNTSTANMTIKGETKPIKEWSYSYNKSIIDATEITIKRVHIKHDDD